MFAAENWASWSGSLPHSMLAWHHSKSNSVHIHFAKSAWKKARKIGLKSALGIEAECLNAASPHIQYERNGWETGSTKMYGMPCAMGWWIVQVESMAWALLWSARSLSKYCTKAVNYANWCLSLRGGYISNKEFNMVGKLNVIKSMMKLSYNFIFSFFSFFYVWLGCTFQIPR